MYSTFSIIYVLFFLVSLQDQCSAYDFDVEEVFRDFGSDLVLPCKSSGVVMWRRPGRNHQEGRLSTLQNSSLYLEDLIKDDSGIYDCFVDDQIVKRYNVTVRTPPPALVNVSVSPSTILASLRWAIADNGGYPITHFTAQFKLKHNPPGQPPDYWHIVKPEKIKPTSTEIDVYSLAPNSSYIFQIWANNRLGKGDFVELEAVTMHDKQEIELGKHLLEGAETFDTRIWVAAVAVVMGTLVVLATATIYALYKECHIPMMAVDDHETMELIPNIILNPGYNDEQRTEWLEPDENSNDTTTMRLNNNTVVYPIRI